MFKRVFKLFQIARKLSTSGAIDTINEIHVLPTSLKIFFDLVSLGSSSNLNNQQLKPGDKLCVALQGMGTTFIKLGQFLATRPDIIGDELARPTLIEMLLSKALNCSNLFSISFFD